MKREFVKTSNAALFDAKIREAQLRGARESGLVAVTGRPGEGKTRTLQAWAAEVGAVMVTAQVDWTPRRMIIEIAEKLGLQIKTGFERAMEEMVVKGNISIIVDEAGFTLANKAACLEKLRGITDKSSTLLVLVFMPRDISSLFAVNLEQFNSRINARCDFKKSTLEDVALVCGQLSEVPIAPELVKHIFDKTDARMRLVINAITRIEISAKLRPEAVRHTPMTLGDLKGVELFHVLGQTTRKTA
ncbi:ATP-binding protein [Rhodoferax sp.]|uniref:ATP-binding protein n=1 Tax=Rhodoferax sp. TaxID=50421 RepID=UPI002610CF07|nr:ATP-binding protein [Rhodoferax sp.]MDD2811669.1 ATP-binding protein [Rhodoferax sp.]MDD4942564.1 ATP-binding protein [Rhodoferax sp.]